MWPDFFINPFFPTIGRSNPNTLPSVGVNVSATALTIELPNHAFRNRDYVGGFFIVLRQEIPTGTTGTLPVLIGTNGDTRSLKTYGGQPVTVANLSGTGVYLIHYNKYTNDLFLVSGYREATTPAVASEPVQSKAKSTQ